MCFAIKEGKVPRLSMKNHGFSRATTAVTTIPDGRMSNITGTYIFQMRCNPIGGQAFVQGNVVNIPVDIAPTVRLLPWNLNDNKQLLLSLSKKEYKKCGYMKTLDLYMFGRQHII